MTLVVAQALCTRQPLAQLCYGILMVSAYSCLFFFDVHSSVAFITVSRSFSHFRLVSGGVIITVVYAAWSAAVVAVSLLCSVLTLSVHSQSGCRLRPSPVPRGFRRLVRVLAKIFVMDCCGVQTVDATDSSKKEKSPLVYYIYLFILAC